MIAQAREAPTAAKPALPLLIAVACCGGTAFVDMYATQPLLPLFGHTFHVGEAEAATTVSALTFGTAIAAPFVGPLADALGRKHVILWAIALLAALTLVASAAPDLALLTTARFAQGLVMPAIFAVTVAYIAEEVPASANGAVMGAYIAGNVLGGFLGRYVAALVASVAGWHWSFVALAALNVAGAAAIARWLPASRRFEPHHVSFASILAGLAFVRRPTFLAAYLVGAAILFVLVAAFTFATFLLAEPPFSLGTAALGNVFCVYLLGVVATPFSGRLVDRIGHRGVALVAAGVALAGAALTLVPSLVAVVAGLAILGSGVFAAQAASQGYVATTATDRRSSAVAIYLTFYYCGGALGASAPGLLFHAFGWPGVVACIMTVQALAALVVYAWWDRGVSHPA